MDELEGTNDTPPKVYHERQSLWLCAQHALNGLLQEPAFTNQDLDQIANTLYVNTSTVESYWWNPHKYPLGLGNYDVNVIEIALKSKRLSMNWFDKRQAISEDNLPNIGIIVSIPSTSRIPFWFTHHWFSLKRFVDSEKVSEDIWWNLDSRLTAPIEIGTNKEVVLFINECISRGGEIFYITSNGSK